MERLTLGKWILYSRQGRIAEEPIDGALTEVLRKRWWSWFSADSHVLPVRAKDPDGREHNDYLAIDLGCRWRANRTILYRDTDEIAQQRIEISPSGNALYVFPDPPDQGYHQHVLRLKLGVQLRRSRYEVLSEATFQARFTFAGAGHQVCFLI
jgi:hypothetical protein